MSDKGPLDIRFANFCDRHPVARFLYGLVFILVCLAIAYAMTVGFPGLDHLLCGGEGTGC